MEKNFSQAPHITAERSAASWFWLGAFALMPCWIAFGVLHGVHSLGEMAVITCAGLAADWLGAQACRQKPKLKDGSAVFYAWLCALAAPWDRPLSSVLCAVILTLVAGKWLTGGLGTAPVHPVLLGLTLFLSISGSEISNVRSAGLLDMELWKQGLLFPQAVTGAGSFAAVVLSAFFWHRQKLFKFWPALAYAAGLLLWSAVCGDSSAWKTETASALWLGVFLFAHSPFLPASLPAQLMLALIASGFSAVWSQVFQNMAGLYGGILAAQYLSAWLEPGFASKQKVVLRPKRFA